MDHFDGLLPVALPGGSSFPPASGASAGQIRNWTDAEGTPDGFDEGVAAESEALLLGGQRPDGSWWYELALPGQGDCFAIRGGSFDEGDSIHFSSGLRLPKAPGFDVRAEGRVLDPAEAFQGHMDDSICVDRQGRAVYFERFLAR